MAESTEAPPRQRRRPQPRQDMVADATNGAIDTEGAAGVGETVSSFVPGGSIIGGGFRAAGAVAHADKEREGIDALSDEAGVDLKSRSAVIREQMARIDSYVPKQIVGYGGTIAGSLIGAGLGSFIPYGGTIVGGFVGGWVGGKLTGDSAPEEDTNAIAVAKEILEIQKSDQEVSANKAFLMAVSCLPEKERSLVYKRIKEQTDGVADPKVQESIINGIRLAEDFRIRKIAERVLGTDDFDGGQQASELLASAMNGDMNGKKGKKLHPVLLMVDEPSLLPSMRNDMDGPDDDANNMDGPGEGAVAEENRGEPRGERGEPKGYNPRNVNGEDGVSPGKLPARQLTQAELLAIKKSNPFSP